MYKCNHGVDNHWKNNLVPKNVIYNLRTTQGDYNETKNHLNKHARINKVLDKKLKCYNM